MVQVQVGLLDDGVILHAETRFFLSIDNLKTRVKQARIFHTLHAI